MALNKPDESHTLEKSMTISQASNKFRQMLK
jgi:hypothetical protein